MYSMTHSLYRTADDQNDERINENSSDADTHDDEVLCNPYLSSLLNGRRISVRLLHMLSEDARRMTIRLDQEADGVCSAVNIPAVLEVVPATPPR